jgi:hypothetical protein
MCVWAILHKPRLNSRYVCAMCFFFCVCVCVCVCVCEQHYMKRTNIAVCPCVVCTYIHKYIYTYIHAGYIWAHPSSHTRSQWCATQGATTKRSRHKSNRTKGNSSYLHAFRLRLRLNLILSQSFGLPEHDWLPTWESTQRPRNLDFSDSDSDSVLFLSLLFGSTKSTTDTPL